MKTLLLLRHAKTEKGDGRVADRDRPLTAKGRADAAAMGRFLKAQGIEPDCILCSPARRTRETLGGAVEAFTHRLTPFYLDRLYNASPEEIFAEIIEAPDPCERLMVVGHNPGLHQIALDLADAGRSPPALLSRLASEFPPGIVARFDFDADTWPDIRPRTGALRLLAAPGNF